MSLRPTARWSASVVAGLALAACGAGGPSDSAIPSAASAAPSAGEAFSIEVVPAEEFPELRTAIAGQREIFLVTAGPDSGTDPIAITASAELATVEVQPAELVPGSVVEVTVVPDPVDADAIVRVTITGARGGSEAVAERTLPVWPETDGRGADAAMIRDRFIPWIEEHHPELGIDASTPWEGTIVQSRVLVVSHYLFLTDEWEMGVEWHVMMAPDDWARMYLRHRFDEVAPSIAAEISSVIDDVPPVEIEPPEAVFR